MLRGSLIIIACFMMAGCGRSVLPPEGALVSMNEAAVRSLVLSNAPIGMSEEDVQKVLARSFRREWRKVDYEARDLVANGGFSVPVSAGDYYLTSDLAVVRRRDWSSDVVTVYFLFGQGHSLRDVSVRKWTDSI